MHVDQVALARVDGHCAIYSGVAQSVRLGLEVDRLGINRVIHHGFILGLSRGCPHPRLKSNRR